MATLIQTMQAMTQSSIQIQNTNNQALTRLEVQVSQLAEKMNEREKGTFPSQPVTNPKPTTPQVTDHVHQVNTLRNLQSGKVIGNNVGTQESQELPDPERVIISPLDKESHNLEEEEIKTPVPYPNRISPKKNPSNMDEIKSIFDQMNINLPMLDMIEQVPAYAKCLKELCTQKGQNQFPQKVLLASTVSDALTSARPVKYKDPGCPTISCGIGNRTERALVDLGASVNLLPYELFEKLNVGELSPTKVSIQLADRSVRIPKGEINDVLIKVGDFIYPVDFIIIDTEPASPSNSHVPIILGRPFLATSNALINCRSGLMKLTVGKRTEDHNVFRVKRFDDTGQINMVKVGQEGLIDCNKCGMVERKSEGIGVKSVKETLTENDITRMQKDSVNPVVDNILICRRTRKLVRRRGRPPKVSTRIDKKRIKTKNKERGGKMEKQMVKTSKENLKDTWLDELIDQLRTWDVGDSSPTNPLS